MHCIRTAHTKFLRQSLGHNHIQTDTNPQHTTQPYTTNTPDTTQHCPPTTNSTPRIPSRTPFSPTITNTPQLTSTPPLPRTSTTCHNGRNHTTPILPPSSQPTRHSHTSPDTTSHTYELVQTVQQTPTTKHTNYERSHHFPLYDRNWALHQLPSKTPLLSTLKSSNP